MSHKSLHTIKNAKIISNITQGTLYIGTHSGTFHCDEALAVSMLKILPLYEKHVVLRTRDPTKTAICDVLVDVGGEYDLNNKRFDHHQKSFNETFNDEKKTKLSSAGLVYKHYGKDIIRIICGIENASLQDKTIEILYKKMYSGFIEHIDGIDNGIEMVTFKDNLKLPFNYNITTSLSNRVKLLNPRWNEEQNEEIYNTKFKQAMELTISEFIEHLLNYYKSWLPARDLVENAITNRFKIHISGEIIKLNHFCPWNAHLFTIEHELLIPGQIKYVLYAETEEKNSVWRIQAVNIEEGSFSLRLALPQEWRGLRDDELSQKNGIDGCIFVHSAGFIGGNKTYDGALQMAAEALQLNTRPL